MKTTMLSLVLCGSVAAGLTMSAPQVEAKPGGCLKYGAAGAVAGHVAGGHAVRGFMAGCAAGMYRRHLYNKQQREQNNAPTPTPTPASNTDATTPPTAVTPDTK